MYRYITDAPAKESRGIGFFHGTFIAHTVKKARGAQRSLCRNEKDMSGPEMTMYSISIRTKKAAMPR